VMDFPLYRGSLVSEDGRGTLIVAELLDAWQKRGDEVYRDLMENSRDEELVLAAGERISQLEAIAK